MSDDSFLPSAPAPGRMPAEFENHAEDPEVALEALWRRIIPARRRLLPGSCFD